MQLDGADAVNASELIEPMRALLSHFHERPISKNNVGGLRLRRRDRAPQGFQRREQFGVGVLRRDSRARPAAPLFD